MTEFLDSFIQFVLGFGLLGIFILAMLDSTIFFFLPFAVDAVLIILVSKRREWMPFYALVTIAGSLAGCVLTYLLLRKASEETVEKNFPKKKFKKVKRKIKEKGFIGLMITSLLPPPFPFSPFVAAAAVTKLPTRKTFAAIAIGRSLRYFFVGFLALLLGRQVLALLESEAFKMVMLGLFLLAAIGTILSMYKWVKK